MRAGEQNSRVHDGGLDDVLPHPPSYQRELDRMAQQQSDSPSSIGEGGEGGTDPVNLDEGQGDNAGFVDESGPMSALQDHEMEREGEPQGEGPSGNEEGVFEPAAEDGRIETFSRIIRVEPSELRRGEDFVVEGRVTSLSNGVGVAQRRVDIMLVSPQQGEEAKGRAMGSSETRIDGMFRLELTLPRRLPIGRWALRVRFEGDEAYGPSASR